MAGALDRLIRSSRMAGGGLEDLGHRVIDIWRGESGAELVLWPTRLTVKDETVLEAEGEQGRWILPAFMAGVRRLTVTKGANVDDALALARELADLEPTQASIETFHNWLWSDGAEGFEVFAVASFVETMDVEISVENLRTSGPLQQLRSSGLMAVGGHGIATEDLDLVRLRAEFDVPLACYRTAAQQEAFRHHPERLVKLRDDLEEPANQLAMEIDAALACDWLRRSIDAKRLARRFEAHLVRPLSAFALARLEALFDAEQEYLRKVGEYVARPGYMAVLARAFDPDDDEVGERMASIVKRVGPDARQKVVVTLIDRCAEDLSMYEGLLRWTALLDLDVLLKVTEGELLTPTMARVFARLVLARKPSMAMFDSLIATLPAMAAVAALAEVPPDSHKFLAERIGALTAQPSEQVVSQVVSMLGDDPAKPVLEALAIALRESRQGRWPAAAAYKVCRMLVERGFGATHVVSVVRARTASEEVRKAALRSLANHPKLRSEASRFRLSEILDPPQLRRRIKKSRQTNKEPRE